MKLPVYLFFATLSSSLFVACGDDDVMVEEPAFEFGLFAMIDGVPFAADQTYTTLWSAESFTFSGSDFATEDNPAEWTIGLSFAQDEIMEDTYPLGPQTSFDEIYACNSFLANEFYCGLLSVTVINTNPDVGRVDYINQIQAPNYERPITITFEEATFERGGIISGTFSGEAGNVNDGTDFVNVTEGRFRIRFD